MKRDEFLARVRTAPPTRGVRYRVHADATIPNSAGYVGGGDDLPAQLAAEIMAVGGQATVVDDLAGGARGAGGARRPISAENRFLLATFACSNGCARHFSPSAASPD